MAIGDRRERERVARRNLIVATARKLAESEGWESVTTRRLSAEIEYSQPVLYKHFAGMDEIADAVALAGFTELAEAIRDARSDADSSSDTLTRVAYAYLDFAQHNPAAYDAMFTRATTLRFASDDAPPALTAGFAELRLSISAVTDGADTDALTELFWAALHGLVTLSRAGRLRPGFESERVELLVDQFSTRS